MDEFEINTGGGYSLLFHSKERRDGLDYYSVTLKGNNAQATTQVYDHPNADSIVDFFKYIAKNWRGLQRKLDCSSMEGEFNLSAIADSTGHTFLTVIIYSNTSQEPPCFEFRVEYILEAGQLTGLQAGVESFFA